MTTLKGAKLSESHRKKISQALTGRKANPLKMAKLHEFNRGKKLKDEHKKKIGMSNKGKVRTDEQRIKYENCRKGFKHNTTSIKRMSDIAKEQYINLERDQKGEKNGFAILTESQAKEIFELANNSSLSHGEIAKMFNTCKSNISAISTKRSWKHIHEGEL